MSAALQKVISACVHTSKEIEKVLKGQIQDDS